MRKVKIFDDADTPPGACPNLRGHLAETQSATSCARAVVYPADSIYTRYTRFGKTGEPSGGRMSVLLPPVINWLFRTFGESYGKEASG